MLAAAGSVFFISLFVYLDYKENLLQMRAGEEAALVVSSGTFRTSLINILNEHRLFTPLEQMEIAQSYSRLINLKRLNPGDEYSIVLSSAGGFSHMVIRRGLKKYALFRSKDDKFSVKEENVPVRTARRKKAGKIETSLWNSMIGAGVPPPVILDFADIFSWSVDFFTEAREGDEYEVVYDESLTKRGEPVSRKILAAKYDGKESGRQTAVFFRDTYYGPGGKSMKSLFLRAPLNYRRISSHFTYKRYHPILKYVRPHLGIDYAAPRGTPVSAVADGTVTFAGWKGGFGRHVEIRHSYGYRTSYGHLWKYARSIKRGKRVKQGQVVGYVGSSGLSTGHHLDFRIKQNGKYLNFLNIKYRPSKNLPKKHTDEFKKVYKSYFPPNP